MNEMESAFLQAIQDDPSDEASWLAPSDWLEESGQTRRAELLRLWRLLRKQSAGPERTAGERRYGRLVRGGVRLRLPGVVNSLGIRLVLMPAGSFRMGSEEGEKGRHPDEMVHVVQISKPFFIGVHAVTQAQYEALTGTNPAYDAATGPGVNLVQGLDTRNFPVEMVSWENAVQFCHDLGQHQTEKQACRRYRLPTEAEWEYACRDAGAAWTPFHFGKTISDKQVNHDASSNHYNRRRRKGQYLERTTPVGDYPSSALGLFDMHGNVWEWCQDWYGHDAYESNAPIDPTGPAEGDGRILRGGCWTSYARDCRAARRYCSRDGYRINRCFGFRVVMTIEQ